MGDQRRVGRRSRRKAVRGEAASCPVIDEVLGNTEPGVACDVSLRVFLAVATDVHIEDPVEALALSVDEPRAPVVVLGVQDCEEVGGEARLGRVVNGELRREVDLAALALEIVSERIEGARLALEVQVALGRRHLRVSHLAGQRGRDGIASCLVERLPFFPRGGHRMTVWRAAERRHAPQGSRSCRVRSRPGAHHTPPTRSVLEGLQDRGITATAPCPHRRWWCLHPAGSLRVLRPDRSMSTRCRRRRRKRRPEPPPCRQRRC